jgi:diguanylate cyclase (GGDEF)-like protein/PAS domain S-box-containing protein
VGRTLHALATRYPRLRARYSVVDAEGTLRVIDLAAPPDMATARAPDLAYRSAPDYLAALRRGELGVVEDWFGDVRVAPLAPVMREQGLACASIEAPVADPRAPLALLSLDAAAPRNWSDGERDTLLAIAAQLGLALRNAEAEAARVRASAELAEREQRFRRLAELSSDWFWETDGELRLNWRPEYATQGAGIHLPEVVVHGKRRWELPDTRSPHMEEHRRTLEAHLPFRDFELERTMPDGSVRYLLVSGLPVFDAAGNFTGYEGVGRDVTERRQAENALRESEATFGAIFRGAWDGLFLIDAKSGRILDCNPRAIELFEAPSKSALAGRKGNRLLRQPLDVPRIEDAAREVEAGGVWRSAGEFVGLKGRSFWGELYVTRLYLPGRSVNLVRLVDVTERRKSEQALRASEALFSAVFSGSRDALFLGNIEDGTVFDCNPRALELFRARSKTHILGRPGHMLLRHPLTREQLAERLRLMELGDIVREDMLFRGRGGRTFWGAMVAVKLQLANKQAYLVRVADISERKEAESRLRESEQRFRDLTELSSDWFWEMDAELRFTLLSGRTRGGLPDRGESSLGSRLWELDYVLDREDPKWDAHRRMLAARLPFRDFVYRHDSLDGVRWASVSGRPRYSEDARFLGYRGTGSDITDRKLSEDRIRHLAQHDELTGLLNRASFRAAVAHGTEQARRHERKLAVLFVDLDRFKNINDTLGHDAGDAVLKEVASRLKGCLRGADIVARQGGDEFVVLMEEYSADTDVSGVARKILDAFALPFQLAGQEFVLSASVGIGTFPHDGNDATALLKAADIAMYRAKESGKNNFQFYAPEMNVHSFERLALEAALRRALERGELRVHYQPKLDLATRTVCGMEALLRWAHPDMGMLPPMQFIPIAEETGLITPIGAWVLLESCRQARAWQLQGLGPLRVAVNLSARQFAQPGLLEEVIAALNTSGLAPESLELEITETVVMQNPERAARALADLDALGVSIAIDDFGTGYSSLAYLKRFPVDTLKIDRSFVKDLPEDADDAAITRAVIALGRSLRLAVVAEGVESPRQLEYLAAHGCDQIQGYVISQPLPAEEFEKLIAGMGRSAA